MVNEQIKQSLGKVLASLGVESLVVLDRPADATHGDYSSNVALVAAKKLGKNPRELAMELQKQLEEMKIEGVQKIEVAGPGFINFWVKEESIINHIDTMLEDKKKVDLANNNVILSKAKDPSIHSGQVLDSSARPQNDNRRKVMVEFTDPNPFKELHIGHLYDNIVGESLSRLYESQGAEVRRVCYQGDVGLHVAKALYGILHLDVEMSQMEQKSLEEKAKFLGQAYAVGSTAYENNPQAKEEIHKLNKMVYEKDPEIMPIYSKGREWSLAYFETIYQRLGTKFTRYYFESEAGPIGIALVKEYTGRIFEESDGAIIFRGEPYGLHTRVFINSLGLPTYEAKELGLAPTKYKDFPYDLSIIVTGNEIKEYFNVLLKALSLIHPDLAAKTTHISHGMVNIKDEKGNRVKMSSRLGNVLTGEWLLDEAKKRISAAYPDMDEETLEMVAVGSIKYALLKSSIGKDISFSFEESISLEGNSGPYLQYTYVRTQSVLGKAGSRWQVAGGSHEPRATSYVPQAEELLLLRKLYSFEEIVAKAAENLAPNTVAEYLFELSQNFNLFYQKQKIVGSDQEAFRLWLTNAVGEVLQKGLDLLGIKAPKKM